METKIYAKPYYLKVSTHFSRICIEKVEGGTDKILAYLSFNIAQVPELIDALQLVREEE